MRQSHLNSKTPQRSRLNIAPIPSSDDRPLTIHSFNANKGDFVKVNSLTLQIHLNPMAPTVGGVKPSLMIQV